MKKKILIFMIATAVVALAGWNISQAGGEEALSDMALENVEALAQESGGGSCSCTRRCNDTTTASCTGYRRCDCNSHFNYVVCDDVTASC
jgi:hypothetical protein